MRIGGSIPPYRLPCGGSGQEVYWLGSANQHYRADDTAAEYDLQVNVGGDVGCPGLGGSFAPCEKFTAYPGTVSCDTYSSVGPFGTWIGAGQYQYSLVAGQVNTVPESWSNSTRINTNFAVCRKAGHKNACARRFWHGMRGFLDYEGANCADTHLTCPDSSTIDYLSYQSTPSEVKFLTISRSVTMNWTVGLFGVVPGSTDSQGNVCGCGGLGSAQGSFSSSGTMTLKTTFSVNPLSGAITQTARTYSYTPSQGGDLGNNLGISDGEALLFLSGCGKYWQDFLDANSAMAGATTSGSISNTNFQASFSSYSTAHLGGALGCAEQDVQVGYDYTLEITLSDEFNAASVYADIKSLLANWPLNDDKLYPWRQDGLLQVAPLVSRNEKGTTSPDVHFTGTVDDLRQPATDKNGNAPFTSIGLTDPLGLNPGDPGYTPTTPAGWTYSPSNNGNAVMDSNGNFPLTSGTNPPPPGYTYNPSQGPLCSTAADWIPTYDTATSGGQSWIPTYVQVTWFDASAWAWRWKDWSGDGGTAYTGLWASDLVQLIDGSILGIPKPAGYQNPFCWQFEDWHGCHVDGPPAGFVTWIYGHGMTPAVYNAQTGAQLPLNATQWTNNTFCIGTPPGASVMYADPTPINICDACNGEASVCLANTGGALIAMKYAEIKENWPSQNFGRPAGADSFMLDESSVLCVSALTGTTTGSTFTSVDNAGNPVTISDDSGFWGGSVLDGFWVITTSGSTVTLAEKVLNVPTGWEPVTGPGDAFCFGRLRWINLFFLYNAPGIAGRAAVTVTDGASVRTLAFNGIYCNSGDSVNLYDANMVLLAGAVELTRVDDGHFTITTPFATIHNAAWITYEKLFDGGSGDRYWLYDSFSKGDYLTLEWLYDRRTNGEYRRLTGVNDCSGSQVARGVQNQGYASWSQTQGCLPFKPCCPAVICFSPNGETWTNGTTYPFPETFTLDERYGSRWQGIVMQSMTDLFWQKPHVPCGHTGEWSSDDGTCQPIAYPHPPQVEARITVPDGFPALPVGIQIGWLSPVNNPPGPGVFDPTQYLYIGYSCANGYPASMLTPWGLRANLCGHLDCNGYDAQNPPC